MERVLKSARESGSLNLSNRSLREVPNEVYQSLDAVGQDENWWETVELQKLILAHNNLEVLKEDLRNLTSLTVLNISHNRISSLPSAVGELPLLKALDISYNQITIIPEEIGSATTLIKLDCSNNLLKELPSALGRCSDLADLKATDNSLTKLPDELVNCTRLFKLDIEGNKVTTLSDNMLSSWTALTELNAARNQLMGIPESIGALSKLIRLDLHQNRISSIPLSIKGCSSLAEIYLGNNLLSTIPDEIGELSRLGTLDLRSNKLKEYPVGGCRLKLSALDLSNNSLSGLPPELGTMTSLRRLLLNGNPIRTLRSSLVTGSTVALLKYLRSRLSSDEEERASTSTPRKDDVIAQAARLSLSSKELNLSGIGLTSVPPVTWETANLIKLDLSKNSIDKLPDELSSCFHLQELILSGNKIKEWPGKVLSSLPSLVCLKLDNNPLSKIPANALEELLKLEILDLSCTASPLPDPSAISVLSQLQELYLRLVHAMDLYFRFQSPNSNPNCSRRTQQGQFPTGVLGLTKLKILNLSQNNLVSIPQEIKGMTSLTELDLSDNNIASLPAELGLLETSLQVLKVDGNPLRSIRRSILDRGTNVILTYLKDKLPAP